MSNRLIWLLIATIVALGIGAYLVVKDQPVESESGYLVGDFKQSIAALEEVRIANAGGIVLHAKQRDGKWVSLAQASNGFPIDELKLAELIQGLSDARLHEMKTSRAENYARLGVEGLDAEDSQSLRVELTSGDEFWQVLIGNRASNGSGHFVRQPEKLQSWLLDRTLSLPSDEVEWLQQPIWAIEQSDVASVTRAGESGWTISRQEGSENGFVLESMPLDRELKYDSILDSVASTLASLRFTALQPYDAVAWQALTPLSTLSVSLADGMTVTVEVVAEAEEAHFVRLSSGQTDEYWQQWQFQVSDFTAQQLSKTLDDFLADVVSEETQSAEEQPN